MENKAFRIAVYVFAVIGLLTVLAFMVMVLTHGVMMSGMMANMCSTMAPLFSRVG